jgi:hypothetical protein
MPSIDKQTGKWRAVLNWKNSRLILGQHSTYEQADFVEKTMRIELLLEELEELAPSLNLSKPFRAHIDRFDIASLLSMRNVIDIKRDSK